MGTLAALVAGLVLWIVLWAVLGTKAFDGFLPTIAFVLIALVLKLTMPIINKYLRP